MSPAVVYVVGMHRSGTSAVTAGLGALGVELGDRLMPGLEDNPKGFFEDLDLAGVNLELLSALSAHWDTLLLPALDTLPAHDVDARVRRAAELLAARFGHDRPVAFKDPRTTRLAAFWVRVAERCSRRPCFLAVLRHPLGVADSLAARDRMPRRKALALWLLHQAEAARLLLAHNGMLVVYDDLLDDPRVVLESLAAFVGETPENGGLHRFTAEFLSANLRHHRYSADAGELGADVLELLCRDLFRGLCAWGRADTPTRKVCSDLQATLARVDTWMQREHAWLACLDELTCLQHDRVESLEAELRRVHADAQRAQQALYEKEQELAAAHAMLARADAPIPAPGEDSPVQAVAETDTLPAPEQGPVGTASEVGTAPDGEAEPRRARFAGARLLSGRLSGASIAAARRTLNFVARGFRRRRSG